MTAPVSSPPLARWVVVVVGVVGLVVLLVWMAVSGQKPSVALSPPPAVSSGARPARVAPVVVAQRARAGVSGRVLDSEGRPVAQATVCAWARPAPGLTSEQTSRPRCAAAGPDGAYALDDLLAMTPLVVSASAPGFAPQAYRGPEYSGALRLAEAEQRGGVDFALLVGVMLQGRVEDVTGGPIAGALVTSSSYATAPTAATSDERGEFTMWVEPGQTILTANAPGYAPGETVGPAPGYRFILRLIPGSTLVGRVVVAGSQTPIEGARVDALQIEGGRVARGTRSGEDGRFRVEGLTPGRYRIEATSDRREGYSRSSVTLGLGETSSEVVVEMDPAYRVFGQVVDTAGKPCEGGRVILTDDGQNEFSEAAIEPDGWARMASVIPGTYRVEVHCQGALEQKNYAPIVIADRDAPEQRWTVERGARLRVTVVDAQGKPVRRANVMATAHDERPNSGANRPEPDGAFLLEGLVAGDYHVTAQSEDGARGEQKTTADATREVSVRIELPAVGRIAGVIEDEDHHPIVRAIIRAQGEIQTSTTSLSDGTFWLDGLPAGTYLINANEQILRSSAPRSVQAADGVPGGEQVEVKAPGQTKLTLVVARRDGVIEGRVVDGAGGPVADAFLECKLPGSGRAFLPSVSGTVVSDPDGHFRIEHLAPGPYTVRASRKGGGEAVAEGVQTGRRDLSLRLVGGGTIAGRLDSPQGPVERFSVQVRRKGAGRFNRQELFFHAGGAFAVRDLPPGTYDVTAENPAGQATAQVTLGEGEQLTDLRLALALRGVVEGRVVSPDGGAPVAGVHVSIGGETSLDVWKDLSGKESISGPDGRFRMEGVLAGSWTLNLMPDDATPGFTMSTVPVTINNGGTTELGSVTLTRAPPGSEPAPELHQILWSFHPLRQAPWLASTRGTDTAQDVGRAGGFRRGSDAVRGERLDPALFRVAKLLDEVVPVAQHRLVVAGAPLRKDAHGLDGVRRPHRPPEESPRGFCVGALGGEHQIVRGAQVLCPQFDLQVTKP